MEITSNDYIVVSKFHRQSKPFKPFYLKTDEYDGLMLAVCGLERVYITPKNIEIPKHMYSLYKVVDIGKALKFVFSNMEYIEKPIILD